MSLSRRSFLSESFALGALPALFADPSLAEALTQAAAPPSKAPTAGELYWGSLYASGAHRGSRTKLPKEDRDPRIAHFADKTGVRWVEDIKPAELPSFSEDAVVTMEISGFRPGQGDTTKLSKVKFAQLHLSCERVTFSEFVGPLVWASLATVFADKASKLPAEQKLTWSALTGKEQAAPAQTTSNGPKLTHMLLSQGAGHMNVAISTTPLNSPLHKVLSTVVVGAGIMSPLLGFPGIVRPALDSFYSLWGTIEKANPENFLLNTTQKDVMVTQQGADSTEISSAHALKLIAGDYVLVPRAFEDDFQRSMDRLIVQNGYVVERDTKGAPDERIATAVPTVSYLTLSVRVQPVSSVAASTSVAEPLLDSSPQSGSSGPSGAKHATPKKPK
jgi:hypothetical protein